MVDDIADSAFPEDNEKSALADASLSRRGLLMTGAALTASTLAPTALVSTAAAQNAAGSKPNIVFILTDNLGYGELGVYGGGILRGAPTPSIDKLASEGMRLLNFNVEAQCTPTRSAFMTGRFSIRSGTYEVPIGGDPEGLTRWEITIAKLLSVRAMPQACGANGISAAPKSDSRRIRDSTSGTAFRAATTRRCGLH